MTVQTFNITTVPNPAGAGAIYQVDGVNNPILNLVRGGIYTFIQSNSSNTNHPIAFKDSNGSVYTVGVVSTGVPGQPGAQTVFTVAANAPTALRYFCITHGNNMGNTITVAGGPGSIQSINIGNLVNDGLGDDLRTAFQKVNANFTSLSDGLSVTVSDATTSGVSLFKQRTGSNLEFKTLSAGTKISLNSTVDSIVINNTTNDAFERFVTDAGSITAGVGNNGAITLQGEAAGGSTTRRKDIEVTTFGSTVSFRTAIPVTDILTSYDFGPINNTFTNTMQLALSSANIDFGIIQFDDLGNETPSSSINLDGGGILYAADQQSYTVNFQAPRAIVSINSPITADGNINEAEFLSVIPISGTVSGTMPNGSTVVGQYVIVTVNRVEYPAIIEADRTFTVNILGIELARDEDRTIDVRLALIPPDLEDLDG
jgi:hypothetical protein